MESQVNYLHHTNSYLYDDSDMLLIRAKLSCNSICGCLRTLAQRAFPDPDDDPSFLAELSGHPPITALVLLDPVPPILRIVGWSPITSGASVPKTPVHKHRHTMGAEREVGATWQLLVPTPPLDSMSLEKSDHPQLCALISLAADTRHHFGALLLIKDITHKGSVLADCQSREAYLTEPPSHQLATGRQTASLSCSPNERTGSGVPLRQDEIPSATAATTGTTTLFPNCL